MEETFQGGLYLNVSQISKIKGSKSKWADLSLHDYCPSGKGVQDEAGTLPCPLSEKVGGQEVPLILLLMFPAVTHVCKTPQHAQVTH